MQLQHDHFSLAATDWDAAGHSLERLWLDLAASAGATLLGGLLLAAVALAWWRRHRYRAVEVLAEGDLESIHAELRTAEERTLGEIVPVVLERSDAHPQSVWLATLVMLLAGSFLLAPWLPWDAPGWLLVCQLGLGALGFALARSLPDFQRRFIHPARAEEMAVEQALQEFYSQGLHETQDKTGILLFVSLLEHRVVVLADEGIASKVDADVWQRADDAILAGIRATSLRTGLIDGVRITGEVLAQHFPPAEGKRNEIPDRVIVRRE